LGVYAGSLKALTEQLKIDAKDKLPSEVSELIKNGITDLQKRLTEVESDKTAQDKIDRLTNQLAEKDKQITSLQEEKKALEGRIDDKQGKGQE